MPLTQIEQLLPQSLQKLIEIGRDLLKPKQILLFGSRARGDFRDNSDFDIAFKGIKKSEDWSRYLAVVAEEPITLHKVDLLIYENTSPEYRKNIDREGIVLYER